MFTARSLAALLFPLALLAREPMAPPPTVPPETRPAPTRSVAALPAPAADGAVYSIDGTDGPPTDEETLYLEYINRARRDPAGEGARLRNTDDAEVTSTYNYFQVDLAKMESEFQAIPPVPPLAFNAKLLNAARAHTQDMFDHAYQGHTGSDSSTIRTRAAAAGYTYNIIAENVFSYSESVFYGHAGFEVDWGNEADGMQTGRGHRVNLHHAEVREIGVGIVNGTNTVNGSTVGPQLVSQEFGKAQSAVPLLSGVAYFDFSGDDFYSIGEGIGQVTVTVDGASYSAITAPSGAFTVPLPGAGTYNVTFSGLGFQQSGTVTSTAGENVKLDFTPTYTRPVVSGPATVAAGSPTGYSFTAAPGATGYNVIGYLRDSSGLIENAENLNGVTPEVGDYSPLQSSIKSQGNSAFNIFHRQNDPTRQYLTLNRPLYLRVGSAMNFSSRLAAAASTDAATVEISTDAGNSWTAVYSQNGSGGIGASQFSNASVNLSSYVGRQVRIRFGYYSNSYFPATYNGPLGWFIDAITFTSVDALTESSSNTLGSSATSFTFTAPAVGSYLLSLVPQNVTRNLPAADAVLVTATNAPVAPTIATPPASATVSAGGNVNFTVAVNGTAPFTYQWLKNGTAISGATQASLTLSNLTSGDAGSYAVTVTNSSGSVTSASAALTVNAALPVITTQPVGATVDAGTPVTLTVAATSSTPITYQWSKNGSALTGQTASSLTLAAPTPADSGNYTVTVTNDSGSATSDIAAVLVREIGQNAAGYLSNLSVRASMTAQQNLILGFVVEGGSKPILVRAAGPALNDTFELTGYLPDPKLTLYNSSGAALATNDNWESALADTFDALGAFAFKSGSKDAALEQTLTSANTVHAPAAAVGGIQLVELYDAGDNTGGKLVNVSARNHVGTGANILIAGFVIAGDGPLQVLIRGVGPGLTRQFNLTGVLADPQLTVYDADGHPLAQNNDWSAPLASTFDQVGAFDLGENSKDAALILTLPPGVYTAQVSGVGGTTGEALVEVYAIP